MHSPAGNRLLLPVPSSVVNARRVIRLPAHIAAVRSLTHDTYEVVVATANGSPPLDARAGQFATLEVRGVARPRSYSFARDPRGEVLGHYTFFIRTVPGGEFSAWLRDGDHTGEAVTITGPMGAFTLDDGGLPMLLLAGGSGLSAVKALAEEACRRQLKRDCLFLYGARTRDDLYMQDEITAIAKRWQHAHRLELVQVLSNERVDSAWSGARGLVTDHLRAVLATQPPWAAGKFKAWLCGPPPMIEAGIVVLLEHGVPRSDICLDVFADQRSPAPRIDNRQCALCDECLLVRPVAGCIVETSAIDADGNSASSYAPLLPGRTAGLYYNSLFVDGSRCIRCYACAKACPHGAITIPA